jgi:hypothetical protein
MPRNRLLASESEVFLEIAGLKRLQTYVCGLLRSAISKRKYAPTPGMRGYYAPERVQNTALSCAKQKNIKTGN